MVTVVADWSRAEPPASLLGRRERVLASLLPPWRVPEFTAGRLTARAALTMIAQRRIAGLEVLRGDGGEPLVDGPRVPRLSLSLSHCRSVVAVAVCAGRRPLGVDIEARDPHNTELLPTITTAGDRLAAGTDPTLVFACKEAAFKSVRGRYPSLAGYPVTTTPDGRATVRCGDRCLHAHWTVRADMVITTAYGSPRPPRYRTLAIPSLLTMIGAP